MIVYTYTCTRPDTLVPFYHDAAEAVDNMDALAQLRNNTPSLDYSNSVSVDELVYTGVYKFPDQSSADTFFASLSSNVPGFAGDRILYYSTNNHTFGLNVTTE